MIAQPASATPLRPAVLRAVGYCAVIVALAILALAMARGSEGTTGTALAITSPALPLIGAAGAMWQTYRTWRVRGRWQPWQGASWLLLGTFLVMLSSSAPLLVG